jgi:hypothetical protein
VDDLTPSHRAPRPFTESDVTRLYTRHLARNDLPPWTATDLDTTERAAHLDLLLQWTDYLNATYTWHPTQLIPPCWPLHPALERELTTLYWTYYEAFETQPASASAAQVWHDRYLPGFHTRLATWTTPDCQQGHHQPRPTTDLLHTHTTNPTRQKTRDALPTALTETLQRPEVPLPPPASADTPYIHDGQHPW